MGFGAVVCEKCKFVFVCLCGLCVEGGVGERSEKFHAFRCATQECKIISIANSWSMFVEPVEAGKGMVWKVEFSVASGVNEV